MKTRRILLIALGTLAVVVAAVVFVRGGSKTACPAIGYAYTGDVELMFSREPASVAACFGSGCTPAPVSRSEDGRWLVPQSAPYLTPAAGVSSIAVKAVDSSGVGGARELRIESESTGEHPYGPSCGGPFRFKPVQVPPS
ncbi:hypothetical protein ACRQ5B_13785 [Pseudarthrobacter sp. L19]|uniref:hypothetical protein n=1 Tax=Pseudarthrobacter sp. L19 TaxID=3423951 RepID=UPI003D7BBFB0